MTIRFLKLSLASSKSIRSWTERILPNGKKVGKILKGDLIDYKNGLPIRDGLSCERIFGPMVSFTCSCGRFKGIETRGIHIVHDTLRVLRQPAPILMSPKKPWNETVKFNSLENSKVKSLKTSPISFQQAKQWRDNQEIYDRFATINSLTITPSSIMDWDPKCYLQEIHCYKATINLMGFAQSSFLSKKNKQNFYAQAELKKNQLPKNLLLQRKIKSNRFYSELDRYYQNQWNYIQNFQKFACPQAEVESLPLLNNTYKRNIANSLDLGIPPHALPGGKPTGNALNQENSGAACRYPPGNFLLKTFPCMIYCCFATMNFPSYAMGETSAHRVFESWGSLFLKKGNARDVCFFFLKKTNICFATRKSLTVNFFQAKHQENSQPKKIMLSRNRWALPKVYCGKQSNLLRKFFNNYQMKMKIYKKAQGFSCWQPKNKTTTISSFNVATFVLIFNKKQTYAGVLPIAQFGEFIVVFYKRNIHENFFLKKFPEINRQAAPELFMRKYNHKKFAKFFDSKNSQILPVSVHQTKFDFIFCNKFFNSINHKLNNSWKKKEKIYTFPFLLKLGLFMKTNNVKFYPTVWHKVKRPLNNSLSQNGNKFDRLYLKRVGILSQAQLVNFLKKRNRLRLNLLSNISSLRFHWNEFNFITLPKKKKQAQFERSPSIYQKFSNKRIPETKQWNENQTLGKAEVSFRNIISQRNIAKLKSYKTLISAEVESLPFINIISQRNIAKLKSYKTLISAEVESLPFINNISQKNIAIKGTPAYRFSENFATGKSLPIGKKISESLKNPASLGFAKTNRQSLTPSLHIENSSSVRFAETNHQEMHDRQTAINPISFDQSLSWKPKQAKQKDELQMQKKQNNVDNISPPRPGKVYKFKTFPPEEIRYCPQCEVELLPNSIRRYRLGYIEFISPVAHIWYMSSSIPLLLNLSKTFIEGIAACVSCLSSGFPPLYRWSYNGEIPISWAFQMQPLKLPISLSSLIFSREAYRFIPSYTIKKTDKFDLKRQVIIDKNSSFFWPLVLEKKITLKPKKNKYYLHNLKNLPIAKTLSKTEVSPIAQLGDLFPVKHEKNTHGNVLKKNTFPRGNPAHRFFESGGSLYSKSKGNARKFVLPNALAKEIREGRIPTLLYKSKNNLRRSLSVFSRKFFQENRKYFQENISMDISFIQSNNKLFKLRDRWNPSSQKTDRLYSNKQLIAFYYCYYENFRKTMPKNNLTKTLYVDSYQAKQWKDFQAWCVKKDNKNITLNNPKWWNIFQTRENPLFNDFLTAIPLKKFNALNEYNEFSEFEKKQQWLKLEGFYETNDEKENISNNSSVSIPLVLPFLGKNTTTRDNVSFKSRYYNYNKNFTMDTLIEFLNFPNFYYDFVKVSSDGSSQTNSEEIPKHDSITLYDTQKSQNFFDIDNYKNQFLNNTKFRLLFKNWFKDNFYALKANYFKTQWKRPQFQTLSGFLLQTSGKAGQFFESFAFGKFPLVGFAKAKLWKNFNAKQQKNIHGNVLLRKCPCWIHGCFATMNSPSYAMERTSALKKPIGFAQNFRNNTWKSNVLNFNKNPFLTIEKQYLLINNYTCYVTPKKYIKPLSVINYSLSGLFSFYNEQTLHFITLLNNVSIPINLHKAYFIRFHPNFSTKACENFTDWFHKNTTMTNFPYQAMIWDPTLSNTLFNTKQSDKTQSYPNETIRNDAIEQNRENKTWLLLSLLKNAYYLETNVYYFQLEHMIRFKKAFLKNLFYRNKLYKNNNLGSLPFKIPPTRLRSLKQWDKTQEFPCRKAKFVFLGDSPPCIAWKGRDSTDSQGFPCRKAQGKPMGFAQCLRQNKFASVPFTFRVKGTSAQGVESLPFRNIIYKRNIHENFFKKKFSRRNRQTALEFFMRKDSPMLRAKSLCSNNSQNVATFSQTSPVNFLKTQRWGNPQQNHCRFATINSLNFAQVLLKEENCYLPSISTLYHFTRSQYEISKNSVFRCSLSVSSKLNDEKNRNLKKNSANRFLTNKTMIKLPSFGQSALDSLSFYDNKFPNDFPILHFNEMDRQEFLRRKAKFVLPKALGKAHRFPLSFATGKSLTVDFSQAMHGEISKKNEFASVPFIIQLGEFIVAKQQKNKHGNALLKNFFSSYTMGGTPVLRKSTSFARRIDHRIERWKPTSFVPNFGNFSMFHMKKIDMQNIRVCLSFYLKNPIVNEFTQLKTITKRVPIFSSFYSKKKLFLLYVAKKKIKLTTKHKTNFVCRLKSSFTSAEYSDTVCQFQENRAITHSSMFYLHAKLLSKKNKQNIKWKPHNKQCLKLKHDYFVSYEKQLWLISNLHYLPNLKKSTARLSYVLNIYQRFSCPQAEVKSLPFRNKIYKRNIATLKSYKTLIYAKVLPIAQLEENRQAAPYVLFKKTNLQAFPFKKKKRTASADCQFSSSYAIMETLAQRKPMGFAQILYNKSMIMFRFNSKIERIFLDKNIKNKTQISSEFNSKILGYLLIKQQMVNSMLLKLLNCWLTLPLFNNYVTINRKSLKTILPFPFIKKKGRDSISGAACRFSPSYAMGFPPSRGKLIGFAKTKSNYEIQKYTVFIEFFGTMKMYAKRNFLKLWQRFCKPKIFNNYFYELFIQNNKQKFKAKSVYLPLLLQQSIPRQSIYRKQNMVKISKFIYNSTGHVMPNYAGQFLSSEAMKKSLKNLLPQNKNEFDKHNSSLLGITSSFTWRKLNTKIPNYFYILFKTFTFFQWPIVNTFKNNHLGKNRFPFTTKKIGSIINKNSIFFDGHYQNKVTNSKISLLPTSQKTDKLRFPLSRSLESTDRLRLNSLNLNQENSRTFSFIKNKKEPQAQPVNRISTLQAAQWGKPQLCPKFANHYLSSDATCRFLTSYSMGKTPAIKSLSNTINSNKKNPFKNNIFLNSRQSRIRFAYAKQIRERSLLWKKKNLRRSLSVPSRKYPLEDISVYDSLLQNNNEFSKLRDGGNPSLSNSWPKNGNKFAVDQFLPSETIKNSSKISLSHGSRKTDELNSLDLNQENVRAFPFFKKKERSRIRSADAERIMLSPKPRVLLKKFKNSNYYGCISQITTWGSDHPSWILFLKYIRANIFKGDFLLPAYFNKTLFQMMPRTGSVMLEQLLSELSLQSNANSLQGSSDVLVPLYTSFFEKKPTKPLRQHYKKFEFLNYAKQWHNNQILSKARVIPITEFEENRTATMNSLPVDFRKTQRWENFQEMNSMVPIDFNVSTCFPWYGKNSIKKQSLETNFSYFSFFQIPAFYKNVESEYKFPQSFFSKRHMEPNFFSIALSRFFRIRKYNLGFVYHYSFFRLHFNNKHCMILSQDILALPKITLFFNNILNNKEKLLCKTYKIKKPIPYNRLNPINQLISIKSNIIDFFASSSSKSCRFYPSFVTRKFSTINKKSSLAIKDNGNYVGRFIPSLKSFVSFNSNIKDEFYYWYRLNNFFTNWNLPPKNLSKISLPETSRKNDGLCSNAIITHNFQGFPCRKLLEKPMSVVKTMSKAEFVLLMQNEFASVPFYKKKGTPAHQIDGRFAAIKSLTYMPNGSLNIVKFLYSLILSFHKASDNKQNFEQSPLNSWPQSANECNKLCSNQYVKIKHNYKKKKHDSQHFYFSYQKNFIINILISPFRSYPVTPLDDTKQMEKINHIQAKLLLKHELFFIMLKEIENYLNIIKKKNSIFKTSLFKMNAKLEPYKENQTFYVLSEMTKLLTNWQLNKFIFLPWNDKHNLPVFFRRNDGEFIFFDNDKFISQEIHCHKTAMKPMDFAQNNEMVPKLVIPHARLWNEILYRKNALYKKLLKQRISLVIIPNINKNFNTISYQSFPCREAEVESLPFKNKIYKRNIATLKSYKTLIYTKVPPIEQLGEFSVAKQPKNIHRNRQVVPEFFICGNSSMFKMEKINRFAAINFLSDSYQSKFEFLIKPFTNKRNGFRILTYDNIPKNTNFGQSSHESDELESLPSRSLGNSLLQSNNESYTEMSSRENLLEGRDFTNGLYPKDKEISKSIKQDLILSYKENDIHLKLSKSYLELLKKTNFLQDKQKDKEQPLKQNQSFQDMPEALPVGRIPTLSGNAWGGIPNEKIFFNAKNNVKNQAKQWKRTQNDTLGLFPYAIWFQIPSKAHQIHGHFATINSFPAISLFKTQSNNTSRFLMNALNENFANHDLSLFSKIKWYSRNSLSTNSRGKDFTDEPRINKIKPETKSKIENNTIQWTNKHWPMNLHGDKLQTGQSRMRSASDAERIRERSLLWKKENLSLSVESLPQKLGFIPSRSSEGRDSSDKQNNKIDSLKWNSNNSLLPISSTRNLRRLRLQYLRNFRRLRFIEYLKATSIKPETMILSLLPVLPPDLRPVIANPRGYITGDINTHYQNVIYRNNNIEKLLDTFWIPKKFYNKTDSDIVKTFYNYFSYRPRYCAMNLQQCYSTFSAKPVGLRKASGKARQFTSSFATRKSPTVGRIPTLHAKHEGNPQSKVLGNSLLQSNDEISKRRDEGTDRLCLNSIDLNQENSRMFPFISNKREHQLCSTQWEDPNILFFFSNNDVKLFHFAKQWGTIPAKQYNRTQFFKQSFENFFMRSLGNSLLQSNHDTNTEISSRGNFREESNKQGFPYRKARGKPMGFAQCFNKKYLQTFFFIENKNKLRAQPVNLQKSEASENSLSSSIIRFASAKRIRERSLLLKKENLRRNLSVSSNLRDGGNPNSKGKDSSDEFRSKKQWFQENIPPLPFIESKKNRSQVLHDSKPLQEMQYSLQKAVDALIDNSQKLQSNVLLRKGRPLKSLSDSLKGKEGRFRQHLLGKRVDYSGRSVIIVGPELKLYECGIPLIMALRLFQPFLILYLIYRFKIASLLATQLIQRKHPMIINLLKKFIETWPVLLNRAPTLHRMNIQAFKIKLVQGKAILLHPLVCSSYNADFDGDQMGVHIPITQQARAESWKLLWSINNSLSISSRQPLFLPSQDMVIGNYYLTQDPLKIPSMFHLEKIDNLSLIGFQKTQQWENFQEFPCRQAEIKPIGFGQPIKQGEIQHQYMKNYSFFSIKEAYQYYCNCASHYHVNTPIWFRSNMFFETSEREKSIEIILDQNGNTMIISKYYEKQFKRNRLLKFQAKLVGFSKAEVPSIAQLGNIRLSIESLPSHRNGKESLNPRNIDGFHPMNDQIFNRSLNPICYNQIIRSTFGRIEFYYDAFQVEFISSEKKVGQSPLD